jgi:murein DD-endopeptidase MepM/ murein hydrolase activator NlpD
MRERLYEHRFQLILAFVTALSIVFNVYLIMMDGANLEQELANAEAELMALESDFEVYEQTSSSQESRVLEELKGPQKFLVGGGETFSKVLSRAGLNQKEADLITQSIKRVHPLNQVKKGDEVIVERQIGGHSDHPYKVSINTDLNRIDAQYSGDKARYESVKTIIPLQSKTKVITGTVNGSLYGAIKRAGADQKMINQFVSLFSYNVDFQRDVKAGDKFKIMYEYQTSQNGKVIKSPSVIMASLSVDGEVINVYRHKLPTGAAEYFDDRGQSVKRALLRTPVEGAKVSSKFGMRNHPIHGYSKMHQGLDYSAATGTPILAAGDGVIEEVKSHYGYGKYIRIKHNQTYSTLYAHMSRFSSVAKVGGRVHQGQVIGYVGSTGSSTGPHLHYEVIQGGKKINPAGVSFPKTAPLKGVELARFKDTIKKADIQLAQMTGTAANERKVAQVTNNKKSKVH